MTANDFVLSERCKYNQHKGCIMQGCSCHCHWKCDACGIKYDGQTHFYLVNADEGDDKYVFCSEHYHLWLKEQDEPERD